MSGLAPEPQAGHREVTQRQCPLGLKYHARGHALWSRVESQALGYFDAKTPGLRDCAVHFAPGQGSRPVHQQASRCAAACGIEGEDLAVRALELLSVRRWSHRRLRSRIWDLRGNVTAYDAAYVALAERLGCRVLTRDEPLSRTPGLEDRFELV